VNVGPESAASPFWSDALRVMEKWFPLQGPML
jgi:hypothetical protein